jgi:hypothetical protein
MQARTIVASVAARAFVGSELSHVYDVVRACVGLLTDRAIAL